MKKVWLFLLISLLVQVSYAQIDSTKSVKNGAIEYTRPSFFHSGKYTINGQQQTFREVSAVLLNNKISSEEFNQAKKYNRLTIYMAASAIAFAVSSLPVSGSATSFRNTPAKVLFGVGCGFIIPEVIFAGKRNKHFRRSVQLYNQQFN